MMLVTVLPWALGLEALRCWCVRATFRGVNAIFGIRVQVQGALSRERPLLLVSNHSSYLDILVLGSQLPVAFTPKKDIARWPIIGQCCALAGCVFVDRTPKALAATKRNIGQKLAMGRVMCLFPEGTTNNGQQLKPFKSSFFSVALEQQAIIQPAAVLYARRNGLALDVNGRSAMAWFDDMALLPHLLGVLSARSIEAKLQLLPTLAPTGERKALCGQSQAMIEHALEQMKP